MKPQVFYLFKNKEYLINKIGELKTGYTLSFLSFVRNTGDIDIHCFEFQNLSLSSFENLDFELKITGKEKRPEIFIPITNNSTLEISAGGNSYNRGMWIKNRSAQENMDQIYRTNFIENILS
jgi:hypothetical protein